MACKFIAGWGLLALSAGVALAEPDEQALGKEKGYPIGTRLTWFYDEKTRVGSFSRLDEIMPHNTLAKALVPLPLPNAPAPQPPLTYRFENQTFGIDDLLEHQRITGLLVIKDGQILAERYRYDRTAQHRLVSHSMAKSITALAIGYALEDKKIASLDDPVSKYVKELGGKPYGAASIRNTLRMSSGVLFKEVYDGNDDVAKYGKLRATQGIVPALRAYNEMAFPQGTRFQYSSAETTVLAAVVRAATGKTLSALLTDKLWQPMGAEANATWAKDNEGLEAGAGHFNAVLRDYGRLGVLLANDGARDGRQIIPKDYLLEATDWKKHPEAFAPQKATPYFGYGYQIWTFPGAKRRFALLGVYGQSIFVDPELKLVLVLTSVAKNASVGKETLARERDALWRGLVARYGAW
jgi:CubicO group peptidase (beta-lactamase class C family)